MLPEYTIPPTLPGLAHRVQDAIDAKTKPQGSLGVIEQLALRMALAQGVETPGADGCLLLFAGDHGLVAEGVSAWPSDVTAQMVQNFLTGGAAANVFARANGCRFVVADAGVAGALPDHPDLRRAGIRPGTRNALREDALTDAEVSQALTFGATLAREAAAAGAKVILLGEMGIGNTSSAALLTHAVADVPLDRLVGPGAGLDPMALENKRQVLERCARRRPGPMPAEAALAAFGGLEIAAMAGAAIGAASARAVLLVDGFIATAAALMAATARPECWPHLIFAHKGQEPGHAVLLEKLRARPLLELDLRLGEGTGALLALPLLDAAARMLAEMATFESAGISGKG
ncbi:MAG: nicotinate-nucleotide--dimethylbenzimidazole phosphoribosyltransferase [Pseudomonadota bacterium]